MQGKSSQLKALLIQLQRESLKKFRLAGIPTLTSDATLQLIKLTSQLGTGH